MFTALPALAVLAVLGAVLAVNHRRVTVEDRLRETRQLAQASANNAGRYLEDQFAVLAAAAAEPDVRAGRLAAMAPYVADVARGGRFGNGLGFIDAQGVSRVSSAQPEGAEPLDLSDREYVRRALSGRPAVSDVLLGRRERRPVLVFAYPTTRFDGTTSGMLAGSLALDELGDGLRRLLYAPEADATIIDGEGNRIVGLGPVEGVDPAPEAWPLETMRSQVTGVLEDVDGHVLAFDAVAGTGWLAVVDRPRSAVIGALDRALYAEIGALVLFAALGVLLTFAFARRLDALDRRREEALDQQRAIAIQLQESMLPRLRVPAGLIAEAGYVPAQGEMSVGGDWYDLVDTGDGQVAMSVGDVAGHGLGAAATMGKLRSATRSAALRSSAPTEALEHLDQFAETLDGRPLATVVYAVLDVASGRLRYASAGHPPPLLLHADGTTEYLEGGRSPLLGIGPGTPARVHADVALGPGDTLILYTDGLVERPDSTIDAGLAALAEQVRAIGHHPARLASELLASVEEPRRDDAAVLAVRLEGIRQPSSVAS